MVIRAEEEDIISAPPKPLNIDDPKLKGQQPPDAVPLSVVLSPYGGKEPIPFDKNKLGHLRDQSVPVKEQPICCFPQSLKSLESYKEEDWTAFLHTRVVDGHKDWTYEHRVYQRKFRSKLEVEEFLKTDGPITGMFRGRKLHKKRIAGLDGHGRGGSTTKSTRGRKAANYPTGNFPVDPNHSIKPTLPHGFL
ncbi:hypothetical protein SETIT_8G070600v2 [Setaria italica]|uniref:MBD domain-containing protein n=2 Tax=Setaria italica TaxID=4555 RepID=A0A368S527_SETIT|nr:hypothetical protein SETIT_8G070600v2 [Setaria italica]